MTPLLWRAFAKINLELRVRGLRPDGYHAIETVLETVDLFDEIRVGPSDDFRFTSTAEPRDGSNLVVRAVRLFENQTSVPVRLHLDLHKEIPQGAGLGGGSSDAAVTLMGLDRHFGTRIPGEQMQRMLARLGSDVPFFSLGGRCLGLGRGEVVFPLGDGVGESDSFWRVVVWPGIGIDTGQAYSWLTQTHESTNISGFCAHFEPRHGTVRPGHRAQLNDFEEPLFERFPELAEIKQTLTASGAAWASLTGSGSALYGAFGSRAGAVEAARKFGGDVRVWVVGPVGRREYFRRIFET